MGTRSRNTWGAATWRLPVLFCLAAILTGTPPSIAEDNEPNEPPDPPREAPLTRFPTTSVIRMETQVSLRDIMARLEAAVPRSIGSPDEFTAYNDTLDYRYGIVRDSLTLNLDGCDFKVTFHANYWLETRARGIPDFGIAKCGAPAEPISILMGYRGRLGWTDDWKLAMRLEAEADLFSFRCKPKPPAHNFTRFLERQVQATFHDTLGVLLTREIDDFDAIQPQVEAAWNALLEPRSLFEDEVWLNWNPVRIEADPAVGTGDMLDLRLSIITDPSIHVGDRGDVGPRLVPDPVVRVSENFVRIPVDVTLPLAGIGDHVMNELRGDGAFTRDMTLKVGGQGSTMTLEILPAGATTSGILLAGTIAFSREVSGFFVKDLAWQPGSADLLAKQFPGLNAEALRLGLSNEIAFDVREELTARRQLLPRAVNHDFGRGVTSRGAITHFIAGDPMIRDGVLSIRHLALGSMWLTAGSVAP